MKFQFLLASLAAVLMLTACSDHAKTSAKKKEDEKPVIKLTLLPQGPIVPGKPVMVLAKLNHIEQRVALVDDDLQLVHTQKFHLLVMDSTFSDYQHIHPTPTGTPGIYSFQFTPKLAAGYRAWADVTPKITGKQTFASDDLGPKGSGGINKAESYEAMVDGYRFTLTFDKSPALDEASMGTIKVTDRSGNPVKTLQPVMGAFGHIVAFNEDYRTVMHTHPMGDEPTNDSARGGPELMFHFEPGKAGFTKIFAQIRVNGKDIYVPFGVNVVAGN